MRERFVIELIYEKISKCQCCCNQCPSKRLAEYINQLGMDEFYQRYANNELPAEMIETIEKRAKSMNL